MMPDMAKHAIPGTEHKSSAKVPAWAVLLTMGGTSITLNFWDATHAATPLFWLIAGLRGFAPVLAAMFISEAGARFDGGPVFRRVTFAIMGGAMLLSASAVANVLRPSYPAGWLGLGMSWLFGIVLDAAALTGLWIILTERERKREAERQGEADHAARAMAEAVAAAEARVAEDGERERARLAAEMTETQAAHEAEMARVNTDLAAANATAEALRSVAHGTRSKRSSGGAPRARKSAQGSADTEDMTTELRALQMLDAHPELRAKGQGAELARRLGVSPAHGRRLHARLTAEERPDSALQEPAHERDDERTDERS
jgi:hypothetical protein